MKAPALDVSAPIQRHLYGAIMHRTLGLPIFTQPSSPYHPVIHFKFALSLASLLTHHVTMANAALLLLVHAKNNSLPPVGEDRFYWCGEALQRENEHSYMPHPVRADGWELADRSPCHQ